MSPDDGMNDPRIYGVSKKDAGWQFGRRSFITLAGMSVMGMAVACSENGGEDQSPSASFTEAEPVMGGKIEACSSVSAHEGGLFYAEFDPDGACMVTYGSDKISRLWRLPGGELIAKSYSSSESFTISPKGEYLFKENSGARESVVILSLPDMTEKAGYLGKFLDERPFAYTYDGEQIAIANLYEIVVGSCRSYEELGRFEGLLGPRSLSFSPDGSMLAAGDNVGRLMVWAWPGGEELFSGVVIRTAITGVTFTPDSRLLIVATDSERSLIYSVPDCNRVKEFSTNPEGTIQARFLNDTTYAALDETSSLNLYSIPDGSLLMSLGIDEICWPHHDDAVLIHLATDPGQVKVMRLSDLTAVAAYPLTDAIITTASVSRDQTMLAVSDTANVIHLVSLADEREIARVESPSPVRFTRFTPDDSLLVTGDEKGRVTLYSLPGCDLHTCLVDLDTVSPDVEINQFVETTSTGGSVANTIPCGEPLPAGAVCTCNCVAGTGCSCVGDVCSCVGDSSSGSHYWYPN